jgi:GNAT superfamily N-acetyltransferase
MALRVQPFEERHLDAAASLLAARHARDRARDGRLPLAFESPATTRPLVEQLFRAAGAEGVVALRDGEPAGYLLARPALPSPTRFEAMIFPPRSLAIPYHGHALAAGEDASLYRDLYAALADSWVSRGFFHHFVNVSPGHTATREAWDSLGFGRELTAAVREVGPPIEGATEVDVQQAGPEDIEVVQQLAVALGKHHAKSPLFLPYLTDILGDLREMNARYLSDPADAHVVAYRDGRPLGMCTFHRQEPSLIWPEPIIYLFLGIVDEEERSTGVGRAILARSLRWAEEQGYRWCGLHFFSANLSGARFWLSAGFQPVEHRLRRHVDERIAWALPR